MNVIRKHDEREREQLAYTDDELTCVCGNTAWGYGLYPCDDQGEIVEPTPEDWTTNWYVCDRCGRVFDARTVRVIGIRCQTAQCKR